jgi:hypothetical protein
MVLLLLMMMMVMIVVNIRGVRTELVHPGTASRRCCPVGTSAEWM